MNDHTIAVLEFPKVIRAIAGHCLTPYGREEVDRIAPMFDRDEIEQRQTEVAEMKDIINFAETSFPLSRVEDVRDIIDRAEVEGSFLDPKELLLVLQLVDLSLTLRRYNPDGRENFQSLVPYLDNLRGFPELKKEIRQAIDDDGQIKDNASPALKKIRNSIGDTRRRLLGKLQHVLTGQRKQAGWQDDVVTQRNGRYVIPVVSGQYNSDMGILHDRSQTGATFYVEPKETVELNNALNDLHQEERREMDRILRALTTEVAHRADSLLENCRIIGVLDRIHACARLANDLKANKPVMDDRPMFELKDARHPLLILQFKDIKKVVPLTLNLDGDRSAVLVTGPNTGGKTIALKTIGLMVLMAQSGLLIPASPHSIVGIFRQVFADIGDEQSIELSLSTFSSHVSNIVEAAGHVAEDTLAIFDEIGAGTDPQEGAALAEAIILHFMKGGARLVASTHYSSLKTLAMDHPELENASLEFDRKTLSPTYRLQLGIPGSSYAVDIARRLGLPEEVCQQAAELVGTGERSLSELIASLESELAEIRKDKATLSDRLEKAEEHEKHYRELSEKLQKEVEDEKRKALKETDELLESTRKETERLVAEIRKTQASKDSVKDLHRKVRSAQDEVRREQKQIEKKREQPVDPSAFEPGDHVRIISLNQEGELTELVSGDRAKVRVGNFNTVVDLRNLERLGGPEKKRTSVSAPSFQAEPVTPEIHLRGMTADEATDALDRFLDNAVVNGLPQVYVIHGKGTGTLRRVLSDYLKNHPEVASIRLGNWNEGGAGVTVVKLKT